MRPTDLENRLRILEKENAELKARIKSLESKSKDDQTTRWLQTIIDSLPNPLFIKDREHNYVLVNTTFEDFVGFSRKELIGHSDLDFFLEDQANVFLEMDAKVLESGRTNWNEEKITVKGVEYEILTSKARIENEQKKQFVLGVITDISDNKNQQVLLVKKNEEIKQQKENIQVLLKEVHHRVKNNLQIVSSLLNLQIAQLTDEDTKLAFINCQNRILAMGRVHDLLTNSNANADINFQEYLSVLIRNIQNAFKSEKGVKFNISVPRYAFDLDTIIPLGLLINEIITNSVKHGMKQEEVLVITIDMRKEMEKISLLVSDDGSSIKTPQNSFGKKSLGMELIGLFCEQLNASCEMKADPSGVSYRINFELELENQPLLAKV